MTEDDEKNIIENSFFQEKIKKIAIKTPKTNNPSHILKIKH